MSNPRKYIKVLTSNDIGVTNTHQAGICVPKTGASPMQILPYLDPKIKNPSQWINCIDDEQNIWKLKFVYYNNKLHPQVIQTNGKLIGTRNEYRITHLTKYLKLHNAKTGDIFEISKCNDFYTITLKKKSEIKNDPILLRGWSIVC